MSEQIQLILNSKTAYEYIDGNVSNCNFRLPQINLKRKHKASITVIDSQLPYSFYNVNSTNNILYYELNLLPYTVLIPKANYNINTLKTYLLSNLQSGFSITYSSSTNKLNFTHGTYDFTFLDTSTCGELLGFNENKTYISTSLSLTSVNSINLFTIRNIQIASPNFILNNINTNTPNKSSILANIPVNVNSNSIISYKNINHIQSVIHDISNITNLNIQILDQDSDLLELNGVHWSLTLLLTIN
jgi:hypothetical protein